MSGGDFRRRDSACAVGRPRLLNHRRLGRKKESQTTATRNAIPHFSSQPSGHCSEVIKAINPTVTQDAIAYRQANGVLTLSVITVMEIVGGFQQNQSFRRSSDFLTAVASEGVLIFDQPAAELAGRIEGELVRTGRRIGMADTMIAAIALTQGLDLSTGDTAHFQRVQQLGYPLTLVNWRI